MQPVGNTQCILVVAHLLLDYFSLLHHATSQQDAQAKFTANQAECELGRTAFRTAGCAAGRAAGRAICRKADVNTVIPIVL